MQRRTGSHLLGGGYDARPRSFLLGCVERFLKSLQPSEALLRLAISSLNMESKARVLELVKDLPTTERNGPTEEEVKTTLADVYDLQRYLMCRVKGAAFGPWWKSFVQIVIQCNRSELSDPSPKKSAPNRVEQMWHRLRLSRVEQSLITFLCCTSCYEWLASFLSDNSRWDMPFMISVAIGSNPEAVCKAVSKQGRLVRLGFIEYRQENNRSTETLGMSSTIAEFLSGVDWEKTISQYYEIDSGKTYELSSFPVSSSTTDLLQSLLRSTASTHILLHGVPGTGKTEFARTLVRSVQRRALVVKHGKEGKLAERRMGLQLATALADKDTDVLIVDEADMILNTGYRLFGQQGEIDKGWVNDFVDKNPAKVIWITNEVSFMDESLLRRFTYNVRFSMPARSKREEIWIREVQAQKLTGKVPQFLIRQVSSKYQLTPAAISSALSTLRRLIRDKAVKDGAIAGTLEEILRTRQSLLQRAAVREATVVDNRYALEALHTDQDLESIEGLVSRHFENQNLNTGVNILFWGLPGTGKTEFARYLAARVGVDLIDRKASELLNLFVGETEKNIRRAFEEAEEQRAILLLDEADSFLRERETAQHSWEMTQVNELLTNIETHRGVLICSTNLIDSFDRASLRRFAFKVQFKPLTSEGRIAIYKRYFPTCYGSLSDVERSSLDNLPDLTLGDFKAVWTKLCLLREGPQENKIVLQALKEESSYRSRGSGEIGFRQNEC